MIEITYADGFFIFLLAWLVLLAVLAWREQLRCKRHKWQLINSNLFHCDNCHHSFIPDEELNLCRCPRCNAVCIRRRRRDSE